MAEKTNKKLWRQKNLEIARKIKNSFTRSKGFETLFKLYPKGKTNSRQSNIFWTKMKNTMINSLYICFKSFLMT